MKNKAQKVSSLIIGLTIAAALPGKMRGMSKIYDDIALSDAIRKRDNTIRAAKIMFNDQIKSALTRRESALAHISKQPAKARRQASKQAWAVYRENRAKAIACHQDAKQAAWLRFRQDKLLCLRDPLPEGEMATSV